MTAYRRAPDSLPGPSRNALAARRRCLTLLAAPLLLPAWPVARAAPDASANLWLGLFAGFDGQPVYWLTRGTEFVVVDGASTPVKGRIGVLAAVARQRDGGTARASYLLHGCNVSATGHEIVPKLVHPITGDEIPTAVTPPLKLGFTFGAGGEVTEDLVAANGTRAAYRGSTWESPGAGDARSATLHMNIRLTRPSGAVEALTEVSVLRPQPSAGAASGFRAAESETFTTRDLLDKARYPGTLVYSANLSHGESYRSVDDLQRAMRPAETAALRAFFEQQAGWSRDA